MTESQESAEATAQTKPKKMRRSLIICGVVFVLILMFLPSIGAMAFRSRAEKQLSEELGLSVKIGRLSAGWFSPVRVGNIELTAAKGETVLEVSEVQTGKSLLGLIFRGKEVGLIHIHEPAIHAPLQGDLVDEIQAALQQIDPRSGLLGKIVNPDNDALLQLSIHDGFVHVRPNPDDEWQTFASDINAVVNIDHTPERDNLEIVLEPTSLQLTPTQTDYGLQFVAPLLAGALNLDGKATMEVEKCKLQLQTWQDMELDGSLRIHQANAEIQAKLIRALVNAIREEETTNASLNLTISKDSDITFQVAEGQVYHSGFAFGLPDLLPNMLLQTEGHVGFDESLDFSVALALPFDKLGEGPVLQELGTQQLTVPVTGTFEEPKIEIGEGKLLGGLVTDMVKSLTNEQIDPSPLLEKIDDLDLLKRIKDRRQERSDASENPPEATTPDPSEPADADATKRRGGLFNRLRERRESRNAKSSDPSDEDIPKP